MIPTLLWRNVGLVKGPGFGASRRVGAVLPAVKVHNARDVDELILLDVTASLEGRSPDHESVSEFADVCFVPLTVGGGITRLPQISALLHAGADKISLGTVLYENPVLVEQAARRFGSQCVVASVDVRRTHGGGWTCLSLSGTRDTGREPVEVAREMVARGAGEVLLTSVDREATMSGYDLDVIERVTGAVTVPVIASGGAGCYGDLVAAVTRSRASAVAAASIFHFTEQTPAGARAALAAAGIPVRRGIEPGNGSC